MLACGGGNESEAMRSGGPQEGEESLLAERPGRPGALYPADLHQAREGQRDKMVSFVEMVSFGFISLSHQVCDKD